LTAFFDGQDIGDILLRPHSNNAAESLFHIAQIIDVAVMRVIRAEDYFIPDQARRTLDWREEIGKSWRARGSKRRDIAGPVVNQGQRAIKCGRGGDVMNNPKVSLALSLLATVYFGYAIFAPGETPSTTLSAFYWAFFVIGIIGVAGALLKISKGS